MKRRVLFLCTGNSCRSQMAEGLVNHFLSDEWTAYSAGTQPAGYVHPLAIAAMAELGIDISDRRSKSAAEFRSVEFDVVITVCDDAAENCPVWLGYGRKMHLGFEDPAKATLRAEPPLALPARASEGEAGTQDERLVIFRQVRDQIRQKVFAYLEAGETGGQNAFSRA